MIRSLNEILTFRKLFNTHIFSYESVCKLPNLCLIKARERRLRETLVFGKTDRVWPAHDATLLVAEPPGQLGPRKRQERSIYTLTPPELASMLNYKLITMS